jgi:hypothetical protein
MSKDYSFEADLSATIGNATTKTAYDKVAENTDEINQRLEGIPYLGSFFENAGTVTYAYNSDGTIDTITHATSPVGTISHDYNADGTLNYIELALTDPITLTIRDTYAYNADGTINTVTRTVS